MSRPSGSSGGRSVQHSLSFIDPLKGNLETATSRAWLVKDYSDEIN